MRPNVSKASEWYGGVEIITYTLQAGEKQHQELIKAIKALLDASQLYGNDLYTHFIAQNPQVLELLEKEEASLKLGYHKSARYPHQIYIGDTEIIGLRDIIKGFDVNSNPMNSDCFANVQGRLYDIFENISHTPWHQRIRESLLSRLHALTK